MSNYVELKNIYKAFSGVPVLQDINFSAKEKNVHALIGGNGAGKSTMMKILSGLYKADKGDIIVEGKKVDFKSPSDAHKSGIYLVPQEPQLYPDMTVEENILLGMPGKYSSYTDKTKKLLNDMNCNISLDQYVRDLPIAKKQQIELIKGLIREENVIILDEPTASLTENETLALFENIRKIKDEKNISFIYITHRLREIFEIADEISVLKNHKIICHGDIEEYSLDDIVDVLVPDIKKNEKLESEDADIFIKKEERSVSSKKIFEVENLSGKGFLEGNVELYGSEILGITGVVGAGRTELAETIFGLRNKYSGSIKLNNKIIEVKDPRDAIKEGIAYLPEDRHAHGGFEEASIKKNISSSILYKLTNFFINPKKESEIAKKYIDFFNIKSNSQHQLFSSLSGGNQQKVVLGKWLASKPKVIILDEPTKGIDANARKEIYKNIRVLCKEGIGVIIISSDFEEIVKLCDRTYIMYNGKTIKQLKGDQITLENITYASFGQLRESV